MGLVSAYKSMGRRALEEHLMVGETLLHSAHGKVYNGTADELIAARFPLSSGASREDSLVVGVADQRVIFVRSGKPPRVTSVPPKQAQVVSKPKLRAMLVVELSGQRQTIYFGKTFRAERDTIADALEQMSRRETAGVSRIPMTPHKHGEPIVAHHDPRGAYPRSALARKVL